MNEIDETRKEFQISGRTFHQPEFDTPNRKANFKVCSIPEMSGGAEEFRMMTVRSEGQFNSIIYIEKFTKKQRDKPTKKDLPLLKNDITIPSILTLQILDRLSRIQSF